MGYSSYSFQSFQQCKYPFIIFPGPYDCTFEQGTCGYRNVEESEDLDTFDWTLKIAGTPSRNTGPSTDHTTGRFGNTKV